MAKINDYFSISQRYDSYGHPKCRMLCPQKDWSDGMLFLMAEKRWQNGERNVFFPDVYAEWCKPHCALPTTSLVFGVLASQIFMHKKMADIIFSGTDVENRVLVPTYIRGDSATVSNFVSVVIPIASFADGIALGYSTFVAIDSDVLALTINLKAMQRVEKFIDEEYFTVK